MFNLNQVAFNIGETVYLVTDPEQLPRMVVAITLNSQNSYVYTLVCGLIDSMHGEIEITRDKQYF